MNNFQSIHSANRVISFEPLQSSARHFNRVMFLICPTGAYCREDRCQSFFSADLIPTMRPPLEECEAAGAVTASGACFDVIDAPALKLDRAGTFKRIASFNPDLIILSITFGSLEQDLAWAALIKEAYPGIPIGLRGAPCYVNSKDILLANSSIKFCMHGDYELVVRHLIEYGIEDAPGISFRSQSCDVVNNGTIFADHLDILPSPDRSRIDPKNYTVRGLRQPQATIRVQRGCPFSCTYCLVHTVSGKRARHRSAQSIIAEMRDLMRSGVRYFYLRADTFTLDREWTLELMRAIKNDCPRVKWVTTTRVEHVDEEVLGAMKAAGCYGISFGLDVTSEAIATQVKKPLRRQEAIDAFNLCRKHGIISLAYVMIGFIWDNQETLQETDYFIRAVCPDLLTIHYAHPYPGTVYYQQVKQHTGPLTIVSRKAQAEPALELGGLSAETLTLFAKDALRRHYRRPKVIASLAMRLLALVSYHQSRPS